MAERVRIKVKVRVPGGGDRDEDLELVPVVVPGVRPEGEREAVMKKFNVIYLWHGERHQAGPFPSRVEAYAVLNKVKAKRLPSWVEEVQEELVAA